MRPIGLAADMTAPAMTKYPDRLQVKDVSAEALRAAGKQAENIDLVISDLEALLVALKQANLLLDADAHKQLRMVLAFVRAQKKFDPTLPDRVADSIGATVRDLEELFDGRPMKRDGNHLRTLRKDAADIAADGRRLLAIFDNDCVRRLLELPEDASPKLQERHAFARSPQRRDQRLDRRR